MFKRRDRRPWWEILARLFYPRGGWGRAVEYIRHRLTRLPDSPHRIARGIWAGVFVSFTPLFGFHFLLAALVAKLIRGNILASLLATFVGNPLTFVPIAASSLKMGNFLLGNDPSEVRIRHVGRTFGDAWLTIWHNFLALFTDADMNWDGMGRFFHEIFLPYLVGGVIPGVIVATVIYYLSVPFIRAYQARRAKTMETRKEARRQKKSRDAGNSPSTS